MLNSKLMVRYSKYSSKFSWSYWW